MNWPEQFIYCHWIQKCMPIREFTEHCSLPVWHVGKRSFLGPEFTKFHLAAGLRPEPLWELTALLRPLTVSKEGRGGRWEWNRGGKERNQRKQREKRNHGKGSDTWNNGVCVPYCRPPLKMSWSPFGLPTQKSWRRHCNEIALSFWQYQDCDPDRQLWVGLPRVLEYYSSSFFTAKHHEYHNTVW